MSRSAVMRRVALVLAVMMVTFVVPLGGGGNVALAAAPSDITGEQPEALPSKIDGMSKIGVENTTNKATPAIESLKDTIKTNATYLIYISRESLTVDEKAQQKMPIKTAYGVTHIADNNVTIYDINDYTTALNSIQDNTIVLFEGGATYTFANASKNPFNKNNIIVSGLGGKATLKLQLAGETQQYYITTNNVLFEDLTIDGDGKKINDNNGNSTSSPQKYFMFIAGTNIAFNYVDVQNTATGTGRDSAFNISYATNFYANEILVYNVTGTVNLGDIQFNTATGCYLNNVTIQNSNRRVAVIAEKACTNIEFSGTFNIGSKLTYADADAKGNVKYPSYNRFIAVKGISDLEVFDSYEKASTYISGVRGGNGYYCIADLETGYFILESDASNSYAKDLAAALKVISSTNFKKYYSDVFGINEIYFKLLTKDGKLGSIDLSSNTNTGKFTLYPLDDAEDKLTTPISDFYIPEDKDAIKLPTTATVKLYNVDFSQIPFAYDDSALLAATGATDGDVFEHCKFKPEISITSIEATPTALSSSGGNVVFTITGENLDQTKPIVLTLTGSNGSVTTLTCTPSSSTTGTVTWAAPANTTSSSITYTITKALISGEEAPLPSALPTVTVSGRTGGGGSTTTPTPTPTITPTPTPTQPIVTITPPPSIPAGTPTPAPTTGWQQGTGTNGPSYIYQDGTLAKGWKKLTPTTGGTEKWYYFDEDGKAISGWLLNGKNSGGVGSPAGSERWYYLNEAAGGTAAKPAYSMAVGWNKVHWKGVDNWYYFKADGVMYTGWFKDGKNADGTDRWYYLKPNRKQDQPMGSMATGWQKVDGVWYYFADSGVMQTGWLKNGNSWYYLKPSGAMVANAWQQVGGKWYWFNSSGAMVTGTQTINGKTYRFNTSGAWIS